MYNNKLGDVMTEIEFYDPEDVSLESLGKKSVIITSFVKRDKWKELKSKFRRVIPIFVRSKQDEDNLKEIISEFDEKLEEEVKKVKELSDKLKKMYEEKRKIEEEVATEATLKIINSVTPNYRGIESFVCFNVSYLVDHEKVSEALKNFCDKHDCYAIYIADSSDWDNGGKTQIILNSDESVKNVDPFKIFGRIFYNYCVIKKDKFKELIEKVKKEEEEAKRRAMLYNQILNELSSAVEWKAEWDAEHADYLFEFHWDKQKVEEIAKKYNLSEKQIKKFMKKVEERIMSEFEEPTFYF